VQNALRSVGGPHPLAQSVVIAAFGTPVRYGWDIHGCAQLIHVLHHRPHDPATPFLTKPLFPPQCLLDVISATWGDWIQAFAVAGPWVAIGVDGVWTRSGDHSEVAACTSQTCSGFAPLSAGRSCEGLCKARREQTVDLVASSAAGH
jgi:hypothetical protein